MIMVIESPEFELMKTLIKMEEAGVPLDDFGNALMELSMLDRFTQIDIQEVTHSKGKSPFGLHGIDHTVRVVFWELYLVEISNRQGYAVGEGDALAAMYAALIHDLSRQDDRPGGQHGKDATRDFRPLLKSRLSEEQLERCLTAVAWHGFSEEPDVRDPVWMLLKDSDALDRARLGNPGTGEGCDPARLRLPVLQENTLILLGCLDLSVVLTTLLTVFEPHPEVFQYAVSNFIYRLKEASNDMPKEMQQASHLITDRFHLPVT
jgi:hypothetical protein